MNKIVCPNCQYQNPPEAQFCVSCGSSMAPVAPPAPQRRSNPWMALSFVLTGLLCLLLIGSGGFAAWAVPRLAAPSPSPSQRPTKTPRPTTPPEPVIIIKTVAIIQTVEVIRTVEVIIPVEVISTVLVEVVVTPTSLPLQPATLTFWETNIATEDTLLDMLIAEFELDNPGITIVREHIDDWSNRLIEAAAINQMPDVWRGWMVSDAGVRAATAPLDNLFDQTFFDQYLAESLVGGEIDAHIRGIPDTYGGSILLYYNKDLVPNPPLTFEDLIAEASSLTGGGIQGFAAWLKQTYWSAGFLGVSGGWPIDEFGNPQLDTPAFISYLTYLRSLQDTGVVPYNCDYTCFDSGFSSGTTAMILNGDWALPNYQASLGEDRVGVAVVPPINGSPFTPLGYGTYYMASTQALEVPTAREAVKKFITYMTSTATQQQWLYQFKLLPSRLDVVSHPFIQEDPVLATKMASLLNSRGMPTGPSADCVWTAWQTSLNDTLDGLLSPEEAAAVAQDSAESCIANLP